MHYYYMLGEFPTQPVSFPHVSAYVAAVTFPARAFL